MTQYSSHVRRSAATVDASSSRVRSMPVTSAPSAPAIRLICIACFDILDYADVTSIQKLQNSIASGALRHAAAPPALSLAVRLYAGKIVICLPRFCVSSLVFVLPFTIMLHLAYAGCRVTLSLFALKLDASPFTVG